MKTQSNFRLLCLAASGLCSLGLSGTAFSSPPLNQGAPSFAASDSAAAAAVARRLFAHQEHLSGTPFDLRARVEPFAVDVFDRATALQSAPDLLNIHRLDGERLTARGDDRVWLPGLVSGGAKFQTLSPAQVFVHRVHQQGLPLARLWESHAALLSIGLNQQGRPGIWLIQKIH